MSRFGDISDAVIDQNIKNVIPHKTRQCRESVWNQFTTFCTERKYELTEFLTTDDIANILKDYAFNMRKQNGEEYKEACVKTLWNTTAKLVQDLYFNTYNRKIDPFTDIVFKAARDARNTKRKQLQIIPEKRKLSAHAFSLGELEKIINSYDDDTPDGLQKKFFHIASFELAWRGGEGSACTINYFKEETSNDGFVTDRIIYNPVFSKTCQGGAEKCAEDKWLTPNEQNLGRCPVRLFKKLQEKRDPHITSNRLFLTPNPNWKISGKWYKNSPVGYNEIAKWTTLSATKIGLDVKKRKLTNHSHRSSIVSHLAKSGINEQELIKITGHNSSSSIKPYLQIDESHHLNIINKIRSNSTVVQNHSLSSPQVQFPTSDKNDSQVTFTNCTFNYNYSCSHK